MREHSLMMLLGSMNAEERLAAFLLNLSQRYAARGYSASEFHLRWGFNAPVSIRDISRILPTSWLR